MSLDFTNHLPPLDSSDASGMVSQMHTPHIKNLSNKSVFELDYSNWKSSYDIYT